jgi:hypothetical protein
VSRRRWVDLRDPVATALAEERAAGEVQAAGGDSFITAGFQECIAEQLFFFGGWQLSSDFGGVCVANGIRMLAASAGPGASCQTSDGPQFTREGRRG